MIRGVKAVVILAAIPVVAVAQVVRPQTRRLETDHELQDPTGLVVGITGGLVVVGNEAFEWLAPGVGGELYGGSKFGPISELRAGLSLSTHAEEILDGRTDNLSLYLEFYFATEVLGMTVGLGPRLAWMQESRAAFVSGRLNGFGAGGALSGLIPIGSRIAIETGAAVSLFQFGPAEFPGTYDADGQSYASVYGFRLGLRYHIE